MQRQKPDDHAFPIRGEILSSRLSANFGLPERLKEGKGLINATLSVGEIGLLFLGLVHSVEPFLDADILVRRLLPSFRDTQAKAGTDCGTTPHET